jgi:hypothetical protein
MKRIGMTPYAELSKLDKRAIQYAEHSHLLTEKRGRAKRRRKERSSKMISKGATT